MTCRKELSMCVTSQGSETADLHRVPTDVLHGIGILLPKRCASRAHYVRWRRPVWDPKSSLPLYLTSYSSPVYPSATVWPSSCIFLSNAHQGHQNQYIQRNSTTLGKPVPIILPPTDEFAVRPVPLAASAPGTAGKRASPLPALLCRITLPKIPAGVKSANRPRLPVGVGTIKNGLSTERPHIKFI